MLRIHILAIKLNAMWITHAARHFLISSIICLFRSSASISWLVDLSTHVSIMILNLILKWLLIVHKFLVFIQKSLFQLIISSRVRTWSLLGNLSLLKCFSSLALRWNFRLMLTGTLMLLSIFSLVLRLGGWMNVFIATCMMLLHLKLSKLILNRHAIERWVMVHLFWHWFKRVVILGMLSSLEVKWTRWSLNSMITRSNLIKHRHVVLWACYSWAFTMLHQLLDATWKWSNIFLALCSSCFRKFCLLSILLHVRVMLTFESLAISSIWIMSQLVSFFSHHAWNILSCIRLRLMLPSKCSFISCSLMYALCLRHFLLNRWS